MSSDAVSVPLEASAGTTRAGELLETLFLEHHATVLRYLQAVTRDEERSLDLAATTFERAFAELRAGRQPGLGWLLRTARNAAIDADRRARVAAWFGARSSSPHQAAPTPEEHTLEVERAASVRTALALLPSVQRDAIALRYTSDLTIREIAEIVGKSPAATQKLVDRGLATLKERLHDLA